MALHHDMGHSAKMTVETGAVALWYQFLLEEMMMMEISLPSGLIVSLFSM